VSACRTCGRSVRKTRVALILRDGTLKGARVCSECESKHGVIIVVKPELTTCKCGKPATECGRCAHKSERRDRASAIEDLTKRVRGQLAGIKASVKVSDVAISAFIDGKIEAFEAVLSLLQEGRA
jgi:hypothetical protein